MPRSKPVVLALILLVLSLFVVHPLWADSKKITAAIDEASQALLKEELAKLGYKVTGDLKVPEDLVKDGVVKTAFKAEMAGKGPGPTVTLWFKIAPEGTSLHSDALREAANTDNAWKATVTAGKAVALSAHEMLTQPEKLKAVQESFKTAKAKEGK